MHAIISVVSCCLKACDVNFKEDKESTNCKEDSDSFSSQPVSGFECCRGCCEGHEGQGWNMKGLGSA